MKNSLKIYTNLVHKELLIKLISNIKLDFNKLEDVWFNNLEEQKIIFFLPGEINKSLINKYFELKNSLFILPKSISNLIINKNNSILLYPTTVDRFKNAILNTLFTQNKIIKNYKINDQKITNMTNNKHCLLTNLEKEIFVELFFLKNVTRQYLEKNILKINPKAETHSLDSHLSRIRKKLQTIDSKLKIVSKGKQIIFKD